MTWTVEIPQYIRKVTLAEKRRARYWVWNGYNFLGKPLPMRFIDRSFHQTYVNDPNKHIPPNAILPEYAIGVFKKNKLHTYYNVNTGFCDNGDIFLHYLINREGLTFKLIEVATKKPVIANPRTIGTPNEVTINAQSLYSGNLHEHSRHKVVQAIKDNMLVYLLHLPVIERYPVIVSLDIYDVIGSPTTRWDLDNRGYLYFKCFMDLMTTGRTGELNHDGTPIQWFKPKLVDDDRLHVTGVGGTLFHPIDNTDQRKLVFTIKHDNRKEITDHPLFGAAAYERDNPYPY